MSPREKIRALLERSACCRVDGELGECEPEPAICGPCWTGGDHRTCEHRVYSPSLQTVQSLTPVLMGLMELWRASDNLSRALHACAFRDFAEAGLRLNARAAEQGEVEA